MKSKLAMGTVQFGLNYGIANQSGRLSLPEAEKILDQATQANIDLLDTAIAYGDCEEVLGNLGVEKFNIVSKLPDLPVSCVDVDSWVERQVLGSLKRLGVQTLYGLLLHRSANLLSHSGNMLIAALNRMKSMGLVKK